MSLKRVGKSVAIQYVGRIFGYVFSLGTIAIITRHLGVSSYGEYTTVLAVASLVITFSDFGFFWSTIHNVVSSSDKSKVVGEIVGIKFVATLALILISMGVVYFGNFSPAVKDSFLVLTVFVLASSINNVLVAVYQSEYRMLHPTIAEAVSRLVNLLLAYVGVAYGFGLGFFVLSTTFSSVINILANWLGLKQSIGLIRPKILGYDWSVYYKTVFLLGLVQLLYATFYRIDVVILSWLKPAVDVGIYGIVVKITEIISAIASIYVGALFPTLVESFKTDKEKYREYISRSLLVLFALAFPIAVLGQWFRYDLVSLIGGREFLTTSTVSFDGRPYYAQTILGLALIFSALNYVSVIFYTALLAAGEMKRLLIFNIVALMTNFFLNIIFVPRYSYLTTTAVTVVTELVILIAAGVYFARKYQYRLPLREILTLMLAVLPPVIYLSFAGGSFVERVGISALLYFGGVLLTVPKSRNMLLMIKGGS